MKRLPSALGFIVCPAENRITRQEPQNPNSPEARARDPTAERTPRYEWLGRQNTHYQQSRECSPRRSRSAVRQDTTRLWDKPAQHQREQVPTPASLVGRSKWKGLTTRKRDPQRITPS
ncbi:hypothetical protein AAHC03_014045 [Spirometra sp. Aus1]